ncbi:Barwin-like endoglucanase, partial [Cynara cardunculus var. scolymus]
WSNRYGFLASSFYGSHFSAVVPSISKLGSVCGVRFDAKTLRLCSQKGTQVIVADLNQRNETYFVLSSRAIMAMANKGMGQNLLELGVDNMEYKRIPCDYKSKNLAARVEESAQKPNHLALKYLYQGGQTEIVGNDIA